MIKDPLPVRLRILKRPFVRTAPRLWHRAASALHGVDEPPSRPVFIIGCPRSGTTLLFRLMRRHESFRSPHREGHTLWNTYQHPRFKDWESDRATAEEIKPGEPRYIYSAIQRKAGGHRYLDKTPKNVLKVSYLNKLFPDASFVLLKRDGRDTVNSLIEGWAVRHGVSYRVPDLLELEEYTGRMWSYVLPPGWRDLTHTSFADIAALQYVTSYETALADMKDLPPQRWCEVAFEDLLERPVKEVSRLLEALELGPSQAMLEMANDLSSYPVQTNSPPKREKWRGRADEINRVMPRLTPVMERLGYEIDHAS